jgi:AAHS family 4-hydroxybenzoate transporter-like MFS transporter
VDTDRVGAFQISIFILCALCLIVDGFDVQAMGYVAPALLQDWQIPAAALGPVFGAALFGILIGSLLVSMMADRFGRRPALIASMFLFGVLTLLTARAQSVAQLLAIRFFSGIGLGGIMPNAMTLTGEYSPRRLRVFLMIFISNGFNAGAMLGGFISAWLIPSFGWRSVFYCGGALPVVIGTVMIFALPESPQFAAWSGRPRELRRTPGGVPVVSLFYEGRAVGTILLWIINFMNLLNLYFLSSWLPTVVREAGYSVSTSVLVGTALQAGGTIGTVVLAWFIARRGFISVLTTSFAVAAVSVALIGQPALSLGLLFVIVFVAGWTVVGGQGAVNALAGTYYPTNLRSTGIGAGLGVGRIGAIIGPTLAGLLIGRHWTPRELFLAAAVPALISAFVMFCLRFQMTRGTIISPVEAAASPTV